MTHVWYLPDSGSSMYSGGSWSILFSWEVRNIKLHHHPPSRLNGATITPSLQQSLAKTEAERRQDSLATDIGKVTGLW